MKVILFILLAAQASVLSGCATYNSLFRDEENQSKKLACKNMQIYDSKEDIKRPFQSVGWASGRSLQDAKEKTCEWSPDAVFIRQIDSSGYTVTAIKFTTIEVTGN